MPLCGALGFGVDEKRNAADLVGDPDASQGCREQQLRAEPLAVLASIGCETDEAKTLHCVPEANPFAHFPASVRSWPKSAQASRNQALGRSSHRSREMSWRLRFCGSGARTSADIGSGHNRCSQTHSGRVPFEWALHASLVLSYGLRQRIGGSKELVVRRGRIFQQRQQAHVAVVSQFDLLDGGDDRIGFA
ncbi:hypothetical protein AWB80_06197 [Caballeronia pedi]|uniref:Uncharacterized protein n=1 Tax=Caballeronia pedi TaxID=1777141 RepID=A0A158D2P5_9BURK|nr:hypothetical protein AWB80_06197 [Caballeronia pedi]